MQTKKLKVECFALHGLSGKSGIKNHRQWGGFYEQCSHRHQGSPVRPHGIYEYGRMQQVERITNACRASRFDLPMRVAQPQFRVLQDAFGEARPFLRNTAQPSR